MAGIVTSFRKYISEDIGISVSSFNRVKATSLPYFILDAYVLYRINILHKECVLLMARTDQEVSPATIKKHIGIIREKFCEDIIFVHPSLSARNRKRLIEYKVPFVIPGNQMYLPDLMIDLREHFFSARSSKPKFSPSTQAVILYILHHFRAKPFIPSDMANQLGYSNTAMGRAFDEIEAANLGQINIEGRQRCFWPLNEKRQFWQKAVLYLKTPVRRQVWIRTLPDELRTYEAGETALSRYSMLAPGKHKTFAVIRKDWDFYKRSDLLEEVKSKEDANLQLQIWNYSPKLLARGETVDKFSLYLSLKDNNDERIQGALEEMMESIQW